MPNAVRIDLEHMSLTIDITNPVWFGNYHEAKLSIYAGQEIEFATPESKQIFEHSLTYVAVMSECKEGDDFVIYAHYTKEVPLDEIAAHIQAITYTEYIRQRNIPDDRPMLHVLPGPTTLH